MTEQQMQIQMESGSTIDVALNPERLKFTFSIATVWIIPVILMLAFLEKANFILLPLWSLMCISWIIGGNSRMSAVANTGLPPQAQDGIELVKSRWLALFLGPLTFAVAVLLAALLIFGGITLASNWAFLGALLTIPTFILVLICSAIALNVYLICTIIGYDDVGVVHAAKKLCSIAIAKPHYLFGMLSDLISATFFLYIVSGIIVAGAVFLTLAMTGAGFDLHALMAMTQGNHVPDSAFVSSIRAGSIAIIIVTWLSFLVNVAAITSSAAYSDDA
ncbi:MAG: hypothetical protein GQ581_01885 [Methyloprofundus sp.]|nr:hypothetical protein [Methyloprofundus sp.]